MSRTACSGSAYAHSVKSAEGRTLVPAFAWIGPAGTKDVNGGVRYSREMC